ncbi:MAG: RodZ domain-containing protein [Sphingomonas sp.]
MEGEPEAVPEQEATLFPATVGDKLRGSREAQGIDLADIAARTRIPQRHLEAIERSNYASLPSITYAIGFAKAYARAVGLDEVALAREVRKELGGVGPERAVPVPAYQAMDPTRSAPGPIVWIGLAVTLLVLAAAGVVYGTDWFRGGVPPPEPLVVAGGEPSPTPSAAAVPETGGQVTLIALDTVWLRITDATGKRLFEKEMAPGERYDVPRDANGPIVRTGRADKIQVTINGSNVAPLGPPEQIIDVPASADALRARGATPLSAGPAPLPRPQSRTAPPRRRRPFPPMARTSLRSYRHSGFPIGLVSDS